MKKLFALAVLLSASFLSTSCGLLKSTPKPFTGRITYEISYSEVPEAMEGNTHLLPTHMVYYFQEPKFRMETSMLGADMVVVADADSKTGFTLIDMFGMKQAVTMSPKDFDEARAEEEEQDVELLDEFKTILGYKCQAAKLTGRQTGKVEYVYFTREIPQMGDQGKGLPGMPLEMELFTEEGLKGVITAREIERLKLEVSMFEIPDGYEIEPMD